MRPLRIMSLLALFVAAPLHAQNLRATFNRLYTFGECGTPLCLDLPGEHGDHYNPGITQSGGELLRFVENAIGLAVGSVPFTAATSGVSFQFEGGAPIATTVSAGPIFADRAETLGRGRLLFGANLTGISFSKIRGEPLDELVLRFTHENVTPIQNLGDPTFERDYIEVETNLDLSLLITTLYATYGVNDRLDIGIAVPLVRASLSGSSQATFVYFGGSTAQTSPHYFGTPGNRTTTAASDAEGSAFGLGDITGRLKFFLASGPDYGIGFLADVRVATGNEDDFLGSGSTTLRLLGITSGRVGSFSPHLNGGVLINGAEGQTHRALATVGFDQLLGQQVTFAADLVGSFQLGESELGLPEPVVFTAPDPVERLNLSDIPDKSDHFMDASVGVKVDAGSDFRVLANVLVPLTNSGLRPSLMWTVGLERTF
jgi:hypothetical protein